jgi:hypothetical protein
MVRLTAHLSDSRRDESANIRKDSAYPRQQRIMQKDFT